MATYSDWEQRQLDQESGAEMDRRAERLRRRIEPPVVNINGSSPDRMVEDILKALRALREADKAVAETAPHPRDWQTVKDGDARFNVARDQHRARLRKLEEVREELEAIGIAIQEQDRRRR